MPFVKYSATIKALAVTKCLQGFSTDEIRDMLDENICEPTFHRWMELYQRTQSVIRNPLEYKKRGAPLIFNDEDRDFIRELVAQQPSLFLDEIREAIYDETGVLASCEELSLELNTRLHLTLKKAKTSNVRKDFYKTAKFMEDMKNVPAEYLVFTDESAICERDLMRVNGRSPKGERVTRWVKRSNPKRYSLLPAIGLNGLITMSVREGSINRSRFESFLEFQLLPLMNAYPAPNSILVMDNCPIHKGGRIEELCEIAGIRLVYLPAYSPELNPIEMCFSVIKAHFKRSEILEKSGSDATWPIRDVVLEFITPELLVEEYEASGYCLPEDMYEEY